MPDLIEAFHTALRLIATLDPGLIEIVVLSLQVSLLAVILASLIGFPLGGALAVYRFPGRGAVTAVLNALMGLPPVVAGLVIYNTFNILVAQRTREMALLRCIGATRRQVFGSIVLESSI